MTDKEWKAWTNKTAQQIIDQYQKAITSLQEEKE
jgi:hypothetical protein